MILDISTQLMTAYAPTAQAANWNNTYLDLLARQDLGAGNDIDFLIHVVAAVTSGGSATVQFIIEGNPTDPTFASGNVALYTGAAIAKAALVAGYQIKGKIPRMPATYRYIRITVTVATADLTAGSFSAWLLNDDLQDNQAYPAGYTVS